MRRSLLKRLDSTWLIGFRATLRFRTDTEMNTGVQWLEGDACWLCMRTKNEILSITTTLKGNIDILVPAIIIVVIQVAQIGGYTKLAALHCSDIIAVQLSDIKASQKKTPGSIGDLGQRVSLSQFAHERQ